MIKIGRFFEHSIRHIPPTGIDISLYDITDEKDHSLLYYHGANKQTRLINQLQKVLKTGQPIVCQEFSTTVANQPHEPLYLIEWHFPIKRLINEPDTDSGAIVSVMLDISELKTPVEQLEEKSKLEALGTLAGGITHDFNNIMAVILGNTEVAQMTLTEDNPARNYLSNIEPDAGTIRVIIKVLQLDNPSDNLWLQAGEYVRLTVIDNGKGIDPGW